MNLKTMIKDSLKILGYPILAKIADIKYRNYVLEDKVVFSSFSGRQYTDNPRIISEKLHELFPEIKQIWLYRGSRADLPEYVEQVKWTRKKVQKALYTSKVWVDSHKKPVYINKRDDQYYINTWHGGLCFKKIIGDVSDVSAVQNAMNHHNGEMTDVFISNSRWLSDLYRSSFFIKGKIWEIGYPKEDVFFRKDQEKIRQEVFSHFDIDNDCKLILYAPTCRKDHDTRYYDFDFGKMIDSVEKRYGGTWKLIIKLHPTRIMESENLLCWNSRVINGSYFQDMQSLSLASDIYITDYSSGIFDFAVSFKPAFILANDLQEYTEYNHGLYFNPRELPFPFSESIDELESQIKNFDYDQYKTNLNSFLDNNGVIRTDHSAEDICYAINDFIKKGVKK